MNTEIGRMIEIAERTRTMYYAGEDREAAAYGITLAAMVETYFDAHRPDTPPATMVTGTDGQTEPRFIDRTSIDGWKPTDASSWRRGA